MCYRKDLGKGGEEDGCARAKDSIRLTRDLSRGCSLTRCDTMTWDVMTWHATCCDVMM